MTREIIDAEGHWFDSNKASVWDVTPDGWDTSYGVRVVLTNSGKWLLRLPDTTWEQGESEEEVIKFVKAVWFPEAPEMIEWDSDKIEQCLQDMPDEIKERIGDKLSSLVFDPKKEL